MNTKIDLTDLEKFRKVSWPWTPISCGKFGYMMIEPDVLDIQTLNFDPENDNPIIIFGEFK
jgi:hypothetical protein